MAATLTVGPHRDVAELDAFCRILMNAFVMPEERVRRNIEIAGAQNVRVIRRGETVAGGLVILPKGQWFGGRTVSMAGIALVAVAPEHRAGGVGKTLMGRMLSEVYANGTALSALWPATQVLYRRAGYECAGHLHEISLSTHSIDVRDRELELRPATEADTPAIEAAYVAWAAGANGSVARSAVNWTRIRTWYDGRPTAPYVVARAERIEGYTYLITEPAAGHRHDLRAHDVVALTAAAARRLLTFFSDHRSIHKTVRWTSGPIDPLLMQLNDPQFTLTTETAWMLRIVNVARALEERGYPPGLTGELHLDVTDELLPENAGRWVLRVADGRGRVERGGGGQHEGQAGTGRQTGGGGQTRDDGAAALKVSIRGLAPLYTGCMTPADLVRADLAAGPAEAQRAAAAIFAGPHPIMRDRF